ncbi:hypothetical protein SNE40_019457 [Patella caerulea]|uniref:U3 small nucleolar RNA-associated protein 14 n=1 Tax=Patella caerulea TaxID=87958 RepID=A0AAN8P5X9_PATCE
MESLLVTTVEEDDDDDEIQPNLMDDESSDEDVDDEHHASLLSSITSLTDQKNKNTQQRTVASADVSEYGFSKLYEKDSQVNLSELVSSLNSSTSAGKLKKNIKTIEQEKVADVPLVKPQQERLTRSIAYQAKTEEISKWQPLVRKNRKAEQLTFPLQQPNLSLRTSDEMTKRFQARTPLEREIAMLLHGSDYVEKQTKMLTPAEERALKAMSLEEAKERRAELNKYRALMTYSEAKFRRQKKIKSKRFHKILRKEKLKKEEKELDVLQKTDPESYLEKIEYADRARVEERMSLKHRGGSKFARKKMMYARYDPLARQAVQDMIEKNKELTKKHYESSEDDSDGDVSMDEDAEFRMLSAALDTKGDNPWMKAPTKSSDFVRPKKITQVKKNTEASDSEEEEVLTFHPDNMNTDKNLLELEAQRQKKLKLKNKTQKVEVFDMSNIDSPGKEQQDLDEDKVDGDENDELEKKLSESLKKEELVTPGKKSRKKKKKTPKIGEDKMADVDEDKKDVEDLFDILENVEKHQAKKKKTKKEIKLKENSKSSVESKKEENCELEVNDDEELCHSMTRKRTMEEYESNWVEEEDITPAKVKKQENSEESSQAPNIKMVSIDPKKLFTIGPEVIKSTDGAEIVTNEDGDNMLDVEEEQRMTIAQAFADDDVIEEFKLEKREIADQDKPKDIDLVLPGWGEWGGADIEPSRRKKKRFTIRQKNRAKRKDSKMANVILHEKKDEAVAQHQVKQLPRQFLNTKQFEQSISQPIGNTWNPEKAFHRMIQPKVVTQLGSIIKPMDKEEMFKKQKLDKTAGGDFNKNEPKKNQDKSESRKDIKNIKKKVINRKRK